MIDRLAGLYVIDFLGRHLRKQFSGPVWERPDKRKRVYFLQRGPSTKSMKRIRQRVKDIPPKSRSHVDPRDVIAELNPVLRGWGQYFRTGNAGLADSRFSTGKG
jgi:RNA-directed DNA polymerase